MGTTLKDTTVNDTGFLKLPAGTTGQRPSSPVDGETRFNTTLETVETYVDGVWKYWPDIVREGLVLHLDASEPDSYSGSGTVWNDLSGVIGNVNVQNRTTNWSFTTDSATGLPCLYNNTNNFGSGNAGINIPTNNGWHKMQGTFEAWLKPTGDHTGGHGWFVNGDGADHTNATNWFWIGTWDTSNILYFRQGNPGTCCNDVTVGSFRQNWYPLNEWHHWVVTWNVFKRTAKIYRDGRLLSSRVTMPTDIPSTNVNTTGQMFNGHERTDNMQFKGYCNIYKLYNRELDNTEIRQNFNATKQRFGF